MSFKILDTTTGVTFNEFGLASDAEAYVAEWARKGVHYLSVVEA